MLVIAGIVFAVLAVIFLGILVSTWGGLTKLGRVRDVVYIAWMALFSLGLLTQESWLLAVTLIPIAAVTMALWILKILGKKVKFEN